MANDDDVVEGDAKRLLAVLASGEAARRGRPVAVGPEDAAATGFGTDPLGQRRLDRAVWRLIAKGALEAVVEEPGTPSSGEEPGAVYRLTRDGLEELRGA